MTTTIINSTIGAFIQSGTAQIGNIIINEHPVQQYTKFRLPRLIDTFYGRDQEFKTLDYLFFNQMKLKVVIHGLPGYGKTELSKQYAKHCLDNGKVDEVFWVEMEDKEILKDLSEKLQDIYEKFKDKQCMFVFDNSLNRQSIFNYEPTGNRKHLLLINSHEADWGPDIESLPLGTLTPQAAVGIIRTILKANYREEDRASYEDLAAAVHCVPLGVQVTAAYMCDAIKCLGYRLFNIGGYIQKIQQSQEFINESIPTFVSNPYTNSIYGAVTISLNKIKDQNNKKSKLALNILYISAFLYPEFIINEHLINVGIIEALTGSNCSESEIELRFAIGILINFSFVKFGGFHNDYIKIHRLTQSCVRYYLHVNDLFDEYYNECLHAVSRVAMDFKHKSSVMSYADDNISAVCQFFKNNQDMVEDILYLLVYNGCSECLKTIFESQTRKQDFEIIPAIKNIFRRLVCSGCSKCLKTNDTIEHIEISTAIKNDLLIDAARNGQLKVIQLLVDYEADINYQNLDNETASNLFIEYVCYSKPNICKQKLNDMLELLNYKQHVQVIHTFFGLSSLHWAALAANEYLITLLTNEDVAEIVNKQDTFCGDTPLHKLIQGLKADSNKEEIVRIVTKLKACGAKLDIKNKDEEETPLQSLLRLSKYKGYDCQYLIEHLTDTESTN